MRGFIPRHLVLRKSFIAHTLCLACPDFKIRLGHFTFTHAGKVFFIRPLVNLPDIVVVDFLLEAFCRSYFTAGLPALPRCSIQDEPTVRVIAQSKNSLAPEGKYIAFELAPERGFQWKGACEITVDELLSGGGQVQTKTMQMEDELKKMLNSGEVSGEELSEYIFTNEHGKLIHPDTFSRTLRKIYDSIGLPHEFHLHTLRHYYVTTLLHSGVDKQTVADLVGHCDTSFLERTYCHPRLDKKRSAAEEFAAVQFGESIRSRP